ncbi:hypothetical protein MMC18_000052 [Xylographa bjoerkii]|nr:hypothetical protein [Xylographa bjoerkii]
MPMIWTDQARAELFGHIIRIHNVKINYDLVVAAMGPECTKNAIMHQVQKLKTVNDDAATPGEEAEATGEAMELVTPKKRGRKPKADGAKTPTRRAKNGGKLVGIGAKASQAAKLKAAAEAATDGDDEEEEESPVTKKVKFEDEIV